MSKIWNEITFPFTNCKGGPWRFGEGIINFIYTLNKSVIAYPWLGLKIKFISVDRMWQQEEGPGKR